MTARREAAHFRLDIQGLRALAVCLVVADHAGLPGFAGGYVGVDIFFVISGFVITQLLLRDRHSSLWEALADFYCRRARRIMPAATVTLVLTLFAAWAALGAGINPNLPGDARWAAVFAANLRLIRTGSNYLVPGVYPSLVTQFWSLSVEEQFYICFPVIILLIARLSRPAVRTRAVATVVVVTVIASAAWALAVSASHPISSYYSPFTRFWELGLGCLLAVMAMSMPGPGRKAAVVMALSGAVMLTAALAMLGPASAYPSWRAWLPCGAAALFIWSGVRGPLTAVHRALSTAVPTYLGNISYALYLMHYLWFELPMQASSAGANPGWAQTLVNLAGALVSAVLLHNLVEEPVRHSARLASSRLATALLAGTLIAATWAAAALVTHFVHI